MCIKPKRITIGTVRHRYNDIIKKSTFNYTAVSTLYIKIYVHVHIGTVYSDFARSRYRFNIISD